jgi:NADH-quinone oxidoreductase subunit M
MLILLILSVLIFGIFVVCFCDLDDVKSTGFVVSIVCFFLSLLLFIEFDNSLSFQHLYFSQWIPEFGITFCIGVDGLSLFFVLLTTFIMPVTILSTWESIKNDIRTCYVLFLSIEVFLVLSFSALDLFLFYFSFESVLIPMVLIIIL